MYIISDDTSSGNFFIKKRPTVTQSINQSIRVREGWWTKGKKGFAVNGILRATHSQFVYLPYPPLHDVMIICVIVVMVLLLLQWWHNTILGTATTTTTTNATLLATCTTTTPTARTLLCLLCKCQYRMLILEQLQYPDGFLLLLFWVNPKLTDQLFYLPIH